MYKIESTDCKCRAKKKKVVDLNTYKKINT